MAAASTSKVAISSEDFDAYYSRLQAAALKATKHSVGLPSDLSFYRSVDKDFSRELDASSERILSLTNRVLALASSAESSKRAKGKGKLEDQDDLVDRFESLIVERMDQLLERADISLDKHTGRTKAPVIAVNPKQPAPQPTKKPAQAQHVVQHASHLSKPQLKFKRKVDNTNGVAWYPTLKHKFHAKVPLGYNLHTTDTGDSSEETLSSHPYRHEITNISYPTRMFQSHPPALYKSFEETPFTWVSTPEQLSSMLDKLRSAREIAVDLEYHSYRTFGGFVCLMQISSREEDWIVDTLELREELEDLNEVFADPNIVKVLHGAESDIVWLQQDFNLYVVNLFDTFHASKVLDFPRHGLATLLEMYCDFTADKRYQLADWRIRPLTPEMLHYARADTHFLLYVYDNLRNALLDRAISRAHSPSSSTSRAGSPSAPASPDAYVREVLLRSTETALREYEREYYDPSGGGPSGWETLARKWNKIAMMVDGPGGMKLEVYKAVHGWRDRVAREEDESTRYILSNHLVFQLAERPPPDMAGLLTAFQSVPPVVRRRAKELLDVIREAVKRRLSTHPTDPAPTPSPAPVEPMIVPMAVDPVTMSTTIDKESLWSRPSTLPLATSSTFLTPSTGGRSKNAPYVAAKSTLFGGVADAASSSRHNLERFQEVVKRIHSTLVIAPSVLKAPLADVVAEEPPPVLAAATEEVAFVPASQRQASKPTPIDDTIVQVGQIRPKKRKRSKKESVLSEDKAQEDDDAPVPVPVEVVPFDYASAPNILDDEPVEDEKKAPRKKQRKGKGGVVSERSDFPRAPRDRTQVKSGNMSHTFR